MNNLIRIIVILAITFGIFKMVDEENYMRVKPLIKSLRIYNEKDTDRYYLVYEINKSMKDLEGSRVYLHGWPVRSEIDLLPEHRQKYSFDNWDFKLSKSEDNIFVRTIESKVKDFRSLSMGIYRLPDGSTLSGKDMRGATIKGVDLKKAKIIDRLDLDKLESTDLTYTRKDLKTFGYYKMLEMNPINTGVIFVTLLAMATCIVVYVERRVKEEYRDKKDIPKVLTLIIVGIYPIFIFIKSGAISTVVDILLGLLIISLILRERPDRRNMFIYIMLLLTMVWWQYVTMTGIAPNDGRQWYKGIMMKYLSLPILFSLVKLRWSGIKRLSLIYGLASIPYWIFFIDNFQKIRFGAGWDTQHMAQIASGAALLGLLYVLFGRVNMKARAGYILLFVSMSVMILKSGVRGVWIAYLPLVLLIFFIKDWRKALMTILILGGVGLYCMKSFPDNYYVQRIASIEKLQGGNRLEMWKSAPDIIKDDPLKGIGIKGFKTYIHENGDLVEMEKGLKESLEAEKVKENPDQNIIGEIEKKLRIREKIKYESVHIHNTYLEILISTGIVGFILYFSTLFMILKRIWGKYSRSRYINEKIFLVWIVLFNVVQGIYGLTEYTLPIEVVQQSIWFIMALALNYEVIRDEG